MQGYYLHYIVTDLTIILTAQRDDVFSFAQRWHHLLFSDRINWIGKIVFSAIRRMQFGQFHQETVKSI